MQHSSMVIGQRDRALHALDFEGVQLRPGPHRQQLDEVCATFAAVSTDSLLYPFRVRRGMPAPGTPLRGWYGEGLFNNLGQFMTLYARLFAATGDEQMADKARELMVGWAATIDESGYFFHMTGATSKEYSFDKLVCGLLDIDHYIGDDQALPLLRRITGWMYRYGDRSRAYAWNGMGPLEWYTLPEYLLRAYAVTGDGIYRDLADQYLYDEFYDALRTCGLTELMNRATQLSRFYQAHSHANTLNSAAAMFETTGEQKYLEAAIAGYDLLRATQTYATGMFGPLEALVGPGQLAEATYAEVGHAEISCPSWAIMRLVRHLTEVTGEARYGDWVELNLFNGVGAAPPTRSDGRTLQYFADYGGDAARKEWGLEWSCCSTTNPISIAEYTNQLYYTGPDSLHVAQYLPSSTSCTFGETHLRLTLDASLPEDDVVRLHVATNAGAAGSTERTGGPEGAAVGTIAFRVPDWLTGPLEISCNGQVVVPQMVSGWARVERVWRNGDIAEVRLPMALELAPVEATHPYTPLALKFGPVVLVAQDGTDHPRLDVADAAGLIAGLQRQDGPGLRFEGSGTDGRALVFVPYAAVPPDEPYAMHFIDKRGLLGPEELQLDPPEAWTAVDHQTFTLRRRRTYLAAETPGAAFTAQFEGTAVHWYGYQSLIGGYADVYIDDELVDRVSQFGAELPSFMWTSQDLTPGEHELRVIVRGDAPEGSRGAEVTVKYLRAVSG